MIELILFAAFVIAAVLLASVLGVAWFLRGRIRYFLRAWKFRKIWRPLASQLGLQLQWPQLALSGRLEGIKVRARLQDHGVELAAEPPEPLPGGLQWMARDHAGPPPAGWSSDGPEVPTGDVVFDAKVRVGGDPSVALALLGEAQRSVVLDSVVKDGIRLEPGTFVLFVEAAEDSPELLRHLLLQLVELAKDLTLPLGEISRRLREHVETEPLPAVRKRNFRALLDRFGTKSPDAQQAARALLGAGQPSVRLLGAAHLGPAGEPVLREFSADPALAAQLDEADALLLAEVLAKRRDPAGEAPLLRLLRHEQAAVRIEAAEALGVCGTTLAVEPLLLHAGKRSNAEARAARDAVAAIQARVVGISGGELALASAAEEHGGLSLAEAAEGRLSVPPEGPPPDPRA